MTRASEGRGGVLTRPIWLALTFAFTALAWSLAARLWARGECSFAASVFAAGLSLGPCLAGYLGAPHRYKQLLRRAVLATGGLSILIPALLGRIDLDLDGFFMLVLIGAMGGAGLRRHPPAGPLRPRLHPRRRERPRPAPERRVVPCR